VDVSANTLVYISPLNPIVTTGIQDSTPGGPNAGSIVKAPSGLWCAIQDVPAQVTGPPDTYYVPQLPYPNSPNAPSGTPLTGDLDNPSVFWVLISQAPVCTA
jgi:hypothetical protein